MQIDLATLPDDPATLQQMLRDVVAAAEQQQTTLQQRDAEIDKLHLLIKRLLRQQFGRRSEQLSADQLQLALEDLEQTVAANEAAQDAAKNNQRRRRETRPNRNHGALPAHLPRYEVLIDVDHRDCPCCGGAMHAIGELHSQQLDIVPAQLRVRVTRRPRYACRTCEGAVVVAPAPERPINGGMATEALVAHVLVSKLCDSLPLYRQSQMLARQGVTLDRSTLSNWNGRAYWWLTPLYDLLVSTVLSAPKLFADDTTLPVLDPGRGRTKTGRIWCYAVDDRPWAGLTHPVAAYVYAERLALDRADSSVTLAFCWAHMRRAFYEFHVSTKSRLPPGCWRKSANSTPSKPRSAASPPMTDDGFARSEVTPLSRLCTPGCRIISGASRRSRIWPRPCAMRSDTGPARPSSLRTAASRWTRTWSSGPSGRILSREKMRCSLLLMAEPFIGQSR